MSCKNNYLNSCGWWQQLPRWWWWHLDLVEIHARETYSPRAQCTLHTTLLLVDKSLWEPEIDAVYAFLSMANEWKWRVGRQTFVWSNGLVVGALDSLSLGSVLMLWMEVCLSFLHLCQHRTEWFTYPSPGANANYKLYDCSVAEWSGSFSIALATALCAGHNPASIFYQQSATRSH